MSDELPAGDANDFLKRLDWVRETGCHADAERLALEAAGFELDPMGYWRLELTGGVEVALEPKILGGHVLAVYVDHELVLEGKLDVVIGWPPARARRLRSGRSSCSKVGGRRSRGVSRSTSCAPTVPRVGRAGCASRTSD